MKKFIVLSLAILMLFMCLPFSALNASAATYSSISLDIPWFCQRRYGDCGIASLAMIEGYYNGGCEDNDANVYNAVYNYNNKSIELSSYSYLGYSLISNDLSAIYTQLKNGNPVMVYRKDNSTGYTHYSVIYGYNGSQSTLQKSGFLVRHTYKNDDNYTVRPAGSVSWTNLESWLSGCTWKQTIVRTSSKIPINGGVSTEVTVVGCDESLNCPFKIYLPANTKVELYYSENKTNYGGTINDSYGQYFESKWEIYLSDGSTEYYIYYGGKYYYMIAVDGVTAEKQHASTRWITTKQPTCKEAGIKSNVCNECGTTISTKTIEQLAHTYDDEWVVLIEPTTTNRGIKARYCLECNIPDYEEIPMLDGAINLASGKDYVTSDIYASNGVVLYPDENGVTLTDGKNAAYNAKYSDTAFVGFNINSADYDKNGYSSVTVDLGNIYAVDKFSAKVASSYNSVAGIYAPALVTVYVSANNQTWVKAGSVVPTDDSSVSTVATTISLDRSVWARYVQFRFVAEATWIFVTEVEVYEGDMTDEPIPNYISGDVNNDFTVDSLDYLLVKRACFGTYKLSDVEFACADIDGSNKIDSTDYLLVKRIAFGTYKVQ